jgi:sugar phosphate isomerase/epimerase
MGYLATRDGSHHPKPFTIQDVLNAAREFGIAGVDMPLPDPTKLPDAAFRDLLQERHFQLVAEYMVVVDASEAAFREYLQRAAFVGAKVVRVIISTVLCGDRRPLVGGWEARLSATAARLKEVLPVAADLGLSIAIENHQDATTDDLLRLHSMVDYHPAFGITLDTGNPLSVGEEPVLAAQRLAPIIRHLHCKDYTIHFAPNGYRLVRCAAGDGVVDFPAILAAVQDNGFSALTPGIEIAAQATRTIPLLEEGWWSQYPERPTTNLLGALRILWAKGRPQEEPYSSAWERGADSATVSAEEWDIVTRSVAYFRDLSSPA